MTLRWGKLYFLNAGWWADVDHVNDYVVGDYKHGPSDLRVAFELLALSNHADAALRLDEVTGKAYERDNSILERAELDEVISILAELPEFVRAALVDEHDRVPLDRIDALKANYSHLDFGAEAGHLPEDGIAEGLSRVLGVRQALERARAEGLDVALT